jgi:hypothetical protein
MAARAAPPRPRQSPCGSGVRRALRPRFTPRPNRPGHQSNARFERERQSFLQAASDFCSHRRSDWTGKACCGASTARRAGRGCWRPIEPALAMLSLCSFEGRQVPEMADPALLGLRSVTGHPDADLVRALRPEALERPTATTTGPHDGTAVVVESRGRRGGRSPRSCSFPVAISKFPAPHLKFPAPPQNSLLRRAGNLPVSA